MNKHVSDEENASQLTTLFVVTTTNTDLVLGEQKYLLGKTEKH